MESASCSIGFSKLNSPAHRYLCLRFKRYLAISPARLEARMLPVRLFHPLQHPGLFRRSPSSPPSVQNLVPITPFLASNGYDWASEGKSVNTSAFGQSRWRGGRFACNTSDVMCHEQAATL